MVSCIMTAFDVNGAIRQQPQMLWSTLCFYKAFHTGQSPQELAVFTQLRPEDVRQGIELSNTTLEKTKKLGGGYWHISLPNNSVREFISFHTKVNKVLFSNKWYLLTGLRPAEFSTLTSSCACSKAATLDVPQHISPWRGACYAGLHGASHLVALAGRKDGVTGEQYKPPCYLHTSSRYYVLVCFISFKTNRRWYACSLRDELRMKIKGDG